MNRPGRHLLLDSSPLTVIPEIAELLGLNEAIVLQQIMYWLKINERDGRNFYQGRHWVYNSVKQWKKTFTFMSESTIVRALKNLRNMKLDKKDQSGFSIVITGNFNRDPGDQTLWYSIDLDALDTFCAAKREMIAAEQEKNDAGDDDDDFLSVPFGQFDQMVPDSQIDQMHLVNLPECLNTKITPETISLLVALEQDSDYHKLFNEFTDDDSLKGRRRHLRRILKYAKYNNSSADDVIDALRICVEKDRQGDDRYLSGILMNKARDRDKGIISPGLPAYWAVQEVLQRRLRGYIKQGYIKHYDVEIEQKTLIYEIGDTVYEGQNLFDLMRIVCQDVERELGISLTPRLKLRAAG